MRRIAFSLLVLVPAPALAVEGFPVALKALHPELEPTCSTCHDLTDSPKPGPGNVKSKGRAYYAELMAHEAARNEQLPDLEDVLAQVDFVVFGDTRSQTAKHQAVVDGICRENAPVAVHTGDVVADGASAAQWTEAQRIESCLLEKNAVVPACGNHEGSGCLGNTFRRAVGYPNRYYTKEVGRLTFLVLDSNDHGSAQLAWLRALPEGPAYVPVFHHPAYPTMSGHGADSWVRTNLLPEFRRLGVKLVLNGHNHGYDRAERDGVSYVTSGGGGAPLYPCGANQSYTKFCMSDYSYVRCAIASDRVDCDARRVNGQVVDAFSVAIP